MCNTLVHLLLEQGVCLVLLCVLVFVLIHFVVVFLCLCNIPLAWIHDLSKQLVAKLESQLGLPVYQSSSKDCSSYRVVVDSKVRSLSVSDTEKYPSAL